MGLFCRGGGRVVIEGVGIFGAGLVIEFFEAGVSPGIFLGQGW